MDKKTKTIVIVVLVLVVLGGLSYGYNRWRQQRLANKLLEEVYGLNAGLLGGGAISDELAREIAKEAARNETDEAKEASETPGDKYKEVEEVSVYDDASKATVNEVKNVIEKVFGKTKLTSLSTNVYEADNSKTSMMDFEVPRLTTGADLGTLSKALVDSGLPIMQSDISDEIATVVAGNSETSSYSLSFEIDGQTISAYVIKIGQ